MWRLLGLEAKRSKGLPSYLGLRGSTVQLLIYRLSSMRNLSLIAHRVLFDAIQGAEAT